MIFWQVNSIKTAAMEAAASPLCNSNDLVPGSMAEDSDAGMADVIGNPGGAVISDADSMSDGSAPTNDDFNYDVIVIGAGT